MAIEKKKVANCIVEEFEALVREGGLKNGDKLPNENEYASQLGVSRLSLREAIQSLCAMGAVVQKPKVGTIVVCDNPDLWIRPQANIDLSDSEVLRQLNDARVIVETGGVRMCTRRAKKKTVQKLKRLVTQQIQLSKHLETQEDYEKYADHDLQFHILIALGSENPFIAQMYASVLQSTRDFAAKTFEHAGYESVEKANQLHKEICEAIEKKDEDRAAELMELHIRTATDFATAPSRET